MKNSDLENVDCHATLAIIEKRWGFPRRTLRALLGMTKSGQSGRSLLPICEADAPLFLNDVYNKRYTSEKTTSRCQQSGRSMIEMLGVLAIIGVLSVGGIAGYSKAMHKYRVNKAIEQITLIAGNIRTFFGRQKNLNGAECYLSGNTLYAGFTGSNGCPIIKKAKIIPDEMLTLDADGKITAITGAFGERVEIKQYDVGDGNTSIEYHIGANEEACIELATYDWRSVNINYIGVLSNGDGSKSSGFSSLPVPIDSAVTACDKIISTGASVRLKFKIKVL